MSELTDQEQSMMTHDWVAKNREITRLTQENEQLRRESKVCTGCGHDNSPVEPPAFACCPDSRYRTAAELLKDLDAKENEVIEVWEANEKFKIQIRDIERSPSFLLQKERDELADHVKLLSDFIKHTYDEFNSTENISTQTCVRGGVLLEKAREASEC